ncbi:hypothetical protein FDP41_003881 [Naegleria fowleri]|uniref:holo-[acyl-carrier-protein] synthase n=1 Tax=Naegleria fowleri TaxID=5763 RepID=A0A6A5BTD5_NAEFO|nr:uncharacterized protein FDP41_003881 [Naegleria fowleri]KAF0977228.1 hypothetical protein FDP41_003881 [Naegleria fowleri]CAG4715584.1 unnamed protein product [Naegleria fowleri]
MSLKLFTFNVKESEKELEQSHFTSLLNLYLETEEEKAKIRKYRFSMDQYRTLMGKVLMRFYLMKKNFIPDDHHSSINNNNLEIHESYSKLFQVKASKYGKPFLKMKNGNSSLDFNISHSGNWVVFGYINCKNETPKVIGIDIEEIHVRSTKLDDKWKNYLAEFFDLMKPCFTSHEWSTILYPCLPSEGSKTSNNFIFEQALASVDKCNDDTIRENMIERFFIHWTLKESFIKAVGMGVSFGELTRIEFRFIDQSSFVQDQCMNLERASFSNISLSEFTSPEKKIKLFIDGEDNSSDWDFIVIRNFTPGHMMSLALGSISSKHIPFEQKLELRSNYMSLQDTDELQNSETCHSLLQIHDCQLSEFIEKNSLTKINTH